MSRFLLHSHSFTYHLSESQTHRSLYMKHLVVIEPPHIMKREEEEEVQRSKRNNNNMSSVAHEPSPSDGSYIMNVGGYYQHHHQHMNAAYPGTQVPPPVGHPPSMLSYSSASLPHNNMAPYYSHPSDGYSLQDSMYIMPQSGVGYPAQAPIYHPPPVPQAQPPLYYGSWPTSNPSTTNTQQQMHYVSYPIIPHEAQNTRHQNSRSNKPSDQYGSLELNVFDVENENLMSALNFVKRNPKATLFDIDGIIPDIARADESASRFIQKRFKQGTVEEKRLGLDAALSSLDDLWNDNYGNFMLQGLFEFGTADMKKELMDAIYKNHDVVALCLHMHGCRVIQKAIRCLPQEDVCKLVREFHDQVLTFINDPNGNHVIQRCIQVMSSLAKTAANSGNPDLAASLSDQMNFIIDDIVANVESLSTHRYGCRVVQRAIEHSVEEQKNVVLEKIISCHAKLVVDLYGNYVVQQVLACGSDEHQAAILQTLTEDGALLKLSKHKYASNVIETVLTTGQPHHKEKILEEMLKDTREEKGGYCCVVELSKDPIANYVVNKAIEVSDADQKKKFSELISSCRADLTKSPYAKYVLQKIDKIDKQRSE